MTNHSEGGTLSKHADILNALDQMQQSPFYAVRRSVLARAEQIIVALERELAAARSALAEEERKLELANQVNGQLSNALSVKHHLLEAAEARAGEAEKERELELMKEALKLKAD